MTLNITLNSSVNIRALTTSNQWSTYTGPLSEARVGPKVGQIGPKWDTSGTFSDQIPVHFGSMRMLTLQFTVMFSVLEAYWKKSLICPILCQFDLIWAQI